ncbi:MAG: autotransporter-associated beta strand repeat-containing protein [Deltaproteobacteria bacterium]|jgi:autotransporter-associated beta strand protein|nr:autotransporter-associated beta strand repeat-containing protein [Deltaproteobacteria bacterium]
MYQSKTPITENNPEGRRHRPNGSGQAFLAPRWINLLSFPLAAILALSFLSNAFAADTIHTEEYYSNITSEELRELGGPLGYILADDAYTMNLTGYGVTVGIIEGGFLEDKNDHIDFKDKSSANQSGDYYVYLLRSQVDEDDLTHGMNVAGIIGAAKNDVGMHGVAYNSTLYSVGIGSEPVTDGLIDLAFSKIKENKNISILNLSYGPSKSNLIENKPTVADIVFMNGFNDLITSNDVLIVTSAGNDGRLSPDYSSSMLAVINGTTLYRYGATHNNVHDVIIDPLYMRLSNYPQTFIDAGLNFDQGSVLSYGEKWKYNLLSISAFNPRYEPTSISFLAPMTNLGNGMAASTLLAPGMFIYGPDYSENSIQEYSIMGGTSQAAPHVSGVAALVKEAFPYLGGKQIGDVLLSTATKLSSLDQLPRFILLQETTLDEEQEEVEKIVAYTYVSNSFSSVLFNIYEENEIAIYIDEYKSYYGYILDSSFKSDIKKAMDDIRILSDEAYISLFGQGIVNAGAAIRGQTVLDANRLMEGEVYIPANSVATTALYTFDLGSYDSYWGRSIGQVVNTTSSSALYNLPVGFQKLGVGTLTLMGKNKYLGETIIKDGTLRLAKGAEISGRVVVGSQGTLAGLGTVFVGAQGLNTTESNIVTGTLSVGGVDATDYGIMSFYGGLVLESTAKVNFDLGSFSTSITPVAGTHYDSISILSGSLVLDGSLYINVAQSGVYTLFDYSSGSYLGNINQDYTLSDLNMTGWSGTLTNDPILKQILLSVSNETGQVTRVWQGTGENSNWDVNEGKWTDSQAFVNQKGNVLSFKGVGEEIRQKDHFEFDTLIFDATEYVIWSNYYALIANLAETSTSATIIVTGDNAAYINSDLYSYDIPLIKSGDGLLVIGSGRAEHLGQTTVQKGTLVSLGSPGAFSNGIIVEEGATLAGGNVIHGPAVIKGILAPGTQVMHEGSIYAEFYFHNGLTLTSTAVLKLDLGTDSLRGDTYDTINVSRGNFVIAGSLNVNASSAGTYRIFDYDTATYTGDILTDFSSTNYVLDGVNVTGTLYNDPIGHYITLTLAQSSQSAYIWKGTGVNASWGYSDQDVLEGRWEHTTGPSFEELGSVITFIDTGEEITFKDNLYFNTLFFNADKYTIKMDSNKRFIPDSYSKINVCEGCTATLYTNGSYGKNGDNIEITKVGFGTLILEGSHYGQNDNLLYKINNGTLITKGEFDGSIEVSAGATLRNSKFQQTIKSVSGSGTLISDSSTTLKVSTLNFLGTLSGNGTLEINQQANLVDANNLLTGYTYLKSATLTANAKGLSGNIILDDYSSIILNQGYSDTLDVDIAYGKFYKTGPGELVFTGSRGGTGETHIQEGILRLQDGSINGGNVYVGINNSSSNTPGLAGWGTVHYETTVETLLYVGTNAASGGKLLTFDDLTLKAQSNTYFDLNDLGTAGEDYNSARVLGTFKVNGNLHINAKKTGFYTLFSDMYSVNYRIDSLYDTFQSVEAKVLDNIVNYYFNESNNSINIILTDKDLTKRVWTGTGQTYSNVSWSNTEGRWEFYPQWVEHPNMELVFNGLGETIRVYGAKNFEKITFSSDGYYLTGDNLQNFWKNSDGHQSKIDVASNMTAVILNDINLWDNAFIKGGQGTLVVKNINAGRSGFISIQDGVLMVQDGTLRAPFVSSSFGSTLAGSGIIDGYGNFTTGGKVSPGGSDPSDYGRLTFTSGLVVKYLEFDLGNPLTAGVTYDSISVTGGSLNLDSSTLFTLNALSTGTYTLFDYTGATFSGTIDFGEVPASVSLNGSNASVVFEHDELLKIITATFAPQSSSRSWLGEGRQNTPWTSDSGHWTDGQDWTNDPGNILSFVGEGDNIYSDGSKHFESLSFQADSFKINGGSLEINPLTGDVGSVYVASGYKATISSPITGVDKILEKQGTGTLILGYIEGNHSYSGGTVVKSGTLRLDEVNLPYGNFTLSPGATLSGVGTIAGPATIEGILSPGNEEEKSYYLNFGSGLTLTGSATVIFDLESAGNPGYRSDLIKITSGDLILAGNLVVRADSSGSYQLFNYGGANYSGNIDNAFSSIVATLNGSSITGILANNPVDSIITYTIAATDQTAKTWEGDGSGGTWGYGSNGWNDGTSGEGDTSGLVVTFSGTGETITVVASGAENDSMNFDTLTFLSDDFTLTGDKLEIDPSYGSNDVGVISVGQSLTTTIENTIVGVGKTLRKVGGGELVLTGPNEYDGGTVVAAGTLRGDTGSLSGEIVNDGVLVFNQGDAGDFDGVLMGSGTVTKEGSGDLVLTQANSHQGTTVIESGRIVAAADNALGSGSYSVSESAGLALQGTSQTVSGVSGQGSIDLGTGSLEVATASGNDYTYGGGISGLGALIKTGQGTLTLTGENGYAGGTKVSGGVLAGDTASLRGDIVNDAQVVFYQEDDDSYDGLMSGEGALIKNDQGVLTLTQRNTFHGDSQVAAGTLKAGTEGALGSGFYEVSEAATLDLNDFDQTLSGLFGSGQISLGNATLTVNGDESSYFVGSIDGAGSLVKEGEGIFVFFGQNSYEGGTTVSEGALVGNSLSLSGDITNNATLTFSQETEGVFDGTLDGSGVLKKIGSGKLLLDNLADTMGSVLVEAGSLIVGSSESNSSAKLSADSVEVGEGALLGGHGTIEADVFILSGAMFAPGNSYGTSQVDGDLRFEAGGYYDVEVNPQDQSVRDKTVVSGTAYLNGAILRHIDTGGTAEDYLNKQWSILEAGTIDGQFSEAVSTLAFLNPTPEYTATKVTLSFELRPVFSDTVTTQNQKGVASSIESLPAGSELFERVVTTANIDNVEAMMDQLSGEVFSSLHSVINQISSLITQSVVNHVANFSHVAAMSNYAPASGERVTSHSLWVSLGGSYSVLNGTDEAGKVFISGAEFSGGYDLNLANGWLAGLVLHFNDKKLRVDDRSSEVDANSFGTSLYFGRNFDLDRGSFRLLLGGNWTRHNINSERRITLPDVQTLKASFKADSYQVFLEASYAAYLSWGGVVEPFASFGWTDFHVDGFRETGGYAALTSSSERKDNTFSNVGLRVSAPLGERFSMDASLGWSHQFENSDQKKYLAFTEGGNRFSVNGVSFSRDELEVGLRGNVKVNDNWKLGLQYNGDFGNNGQNHSGSLVVTSTW